MSTATASAANRPKRYRRKRMELPEGLIKLMQVRG